jgi:hypothetical protein
MSKGYVGHFINMLAYFKASAPLRSRLRSKPRALFRYVGELLSTRKNAFAVPFAIERYLLDGSQLARHQMIQEG